MKPSNLFAIATLSGFALFASVTTFAASKAEIDVSVTESLQRFHMLNKNNETLEHKAAGVLIFPEVTKGGAGVAGEYGEGALQVKGKTVAYYSINSASIGLTLGVSKRSEILMFMTQASLDNFVASKGWSIGAVIPASLSSRVQAPATTRKP